MADTKQEDNKNIGEFQRIFTMRLLFEDKTERVSTEKTLAALSARLGDIDIVSPVEANNLASFAIKSKAIEYADKAKMPAQVLMGDFDTFDWEKELDDMQKMQLWDIPNPQDFLASAKYSILLSDFVAAGLDYLDRCSLLTDWLEIMFELYPTAKGVWMPAAGRLLSREQVLNNPLEGAARFIYIGINMRSFNIQGTEADCVVDSIGMYAIGLPEVQYHFRGLNTGQVVNHAYSLLEYQFMKDCPIQMDDTIAGLELTEDAPKWKCRYETSLIPPLRDVLDIEAGEFAAGNRDREEKTNG